MYSDLFVNFSIVLAQLFIIGQILKRDYSSKSDPFRIRILLGICFGALGIFLMIYSIKVSGTVIVDLRNIATISSAVMGGPMSVIITCIIIALFRLAYYGINTASIVGMSVAIAIGMFCSFVSKTSFSNMKKYIVMNIFGLFATCMAFIYLIDDELSSRKILFDYIWISLLGAIITYFAIEYIMSMQKIELSLEESNKQIVDILESIKDAFFTLDRERRITYANSEFEKYVNKYNGKIVGRRILDLFPQVEDEKIYKEYTKTLKDRKSVYFERFFKETNGWFAINIYPKSDGISVFFRDITEQKNIENELEKSNARFKAMFDNANVGISFRNFDLKLIDANPFLLELLGYNSEEASELEKLIYCEDVEDELKNMRDIKDGKRDSYTREIRYMKKDGNVLWAEVSVSVVSGTDTSEPYIIRMINDITGRKAAEEKMNKLNRDLVEQRIEAERQREEAIEANRHKSQFLATMSHEFRTPLNSIIGFTNRVIKKCGDVLPKIQMENLVIVKGEAQHLLELISDLLDYSKMEAGKMEIYPEEFDLSYTLDEVFVMLRSMIEGKDIKYKQELPPTNEIMIYSDKLKVKQILINILSNAFKYSEKGTVKLSVNIQCGFYEIAVQDEGIGISPDNIKSIFEEFKQVDGSHTRRFEGTGLGLSITKKFVEMLGGSIRVNSALGEGSTFTIVLPIKYHDEH